MTGVGRGRGWLNLKAASGGPISPGSQSSQGSLSPHDTNQPLNPPISGNTQGTDIFSDYFGIVNKIKQLDLADDGIKFNQKIRYIVESWSEDCSNGQQVSECFDIIHEACLTDSDLATKVVLLIASRTFLNQTIHDNNIRLMFLRKLQDNFESCVEMQKQNPHGFRNSVQMMGEFYSKARMANGKQFSFMATALCSYLEMLLESARPHDLKLFTIQLYSNGASLKSETPEQMTDLLNKTRLLLCNGKNLSNECRLWLLLALEVAGNRFALLPAEIQKFYHDHLGENNMASFQGLPTVLSVQTHQGSKKLDSYQSNVNVLQVSDSMNSSNEQNITSLLNATSTTDNYNSSGFHSDSSDNSHVNTIVKDLRDKLNNSTNTTQPSSGIHHLSEQPQQQHLANKPSQQPTGRPILGVGARLQRNRITTDVSSTSNNDHLTSGFENSWRDSKERVNQDRRDSRDNKDGSRDNWRSHSNQNQNKKTGGDKNQKKTFSAGEWGGNDKNQRKKSIGGEWGNEKIHKNASSEAEWGCEKYQNKPSSGGEPQIKSSSGGEWGNEKTQKNESSGGAKWGYEKYQNKPSSGGEPQIKSSSGGERGCENIQRRLSSGGGNWGDNKKKGSPPKQSTKGWQHDDRFENDYS